MTPFDKELSRYLDRHAEACDVWEPIQRRMQAGKEINTPYIPEPAEPPRKNRRRIVTFSAFAAAALVVAAAGALALAARHARPQPSPMQPILSAGTTACTTAGMTAGMSTNTSVQAESSAVAGNTTTSQASSAQGTVHVEAVYPGGAVLWIELERYDEASNTIHAQIHNETAGEYTYGMYFSLLRRENGKWVPCESIPDWAIPDIAALLEPKSKRPQSFCLDAYFPNGLEPGDFRIELQLYAASEEAQNVVIPLEIHVAYR